MNVPSGTAGWTLNVEPVPAAVELGAVRAAAAVDVGRGRVLDGHFNAVERLRVQVEPKLAARELAAVGEDGLRLGVWGADPAPGEGEPARIAGGALHGTKTFCSGAGEVHRAFVLVAGELVYVDLTAGRVDVDLGWWRGSAMRSSASHRVTFDGVPVLWSARGALTAEPWIHRDALRTAASWVGGLDALVDAAVAVLRSKPSSGDLEALAVGRLLTARRTADVWLRAAAAAMDADDDLRDVAVYGRAAIAAAITAAIDEGARALGARPLATRDRFAQVRDDLSTYVLQHRLDPIVARAGRAALDA